MSKFQSFTATILHKGDELHAYYDYFCQKCGERTYWQSVGLKAHFCSTECFDKAWQEYLEGIKP